MVQGITEIPADEGELYMADAIGVFSHRLL